MSNRVFVCLVQIRKKVDSIDVFILPSTDWVKKVEKDPTKSESR